MCGKTHIDRGLDKAQKPGRVVGMKQWVLLYQGVGDPSKEEEAAVLAHLPADALVDRSPGMLMVTGDSVIKIREVVALHPLWHYAPVVTIDIPPTSP